MVKVSSPGTRVRSTPRIRCNSVARSRETNLGWLPRMVLLQGVDGQGIQPRHPGQVHPKDPVQLGGQVQGDEPGLVASNGSLARCRWSRYPAQAPGSGPPQGSGATRWPGPGRRTWAGCLEWFSCGEGRQQGLVLAGSQRLVVVAPSRRRTRPGGAGSSDRLPGPDAG